jgi:hypothetical protein
VCDPEAGSSVSAQLGRRGPALDRDVREQRTGSLDLADGAELLKSWKGGCELPLGLRRLAAAKDLSDQ